jgi:hypothetical protein
MSLSCGTLFSATAKTQNIGKPIYRRGWFCPIITDMKVYLETIGCRLNESEIEAMARSYA